MLRFIFFLVLITPIAVHATQIQTKQIADGAVTNPKVNDVSVAKITSAATAFFTYKPNNVSCTDAQVLSWDNANQRWQCATTGGSGTVTLVATGSTLTGGPITTTGTLNVASGGITSNELAALSVTDAKVNDVRVSKITSAASAYFTYQPNATECAYGQILAYDGTTNGKRWHCQNLSNNNLIADAGAENRSTGTSFAWSADGGALSTATSGTNLLIGKASLTWDASASGQILRTSTFPYTAGYAGKQGMLRCLFATPTGTATHNIDLIADQSPFNLISTSTIPSSATPTYFTRYFTFPATAGNMQVQISSVASNEPLIVIDDCYVGPAQDFSTIGNNSGSYLTYKPNNVACLNNQILSYDNTNDRWSCSTITWSSISNAAGVYNTYKPNNVSCNDSEQLVWDNTNQRWSCSFTTRAWARINQKVTANLTGTYSQSGTTVTVTVANHGMKAGQWTYNDYTTGTAVDGGFVVQTVADANTFTVTAAASLTTSGNVTLTRHSFSGGNIAFVAKFGALTGLSVVNFTNAMPDNNYGISGGSCIGGSAQYGTVSALGQASGNFPAGMPSGALANYFPINVQTGGSGASIDCDAVYITVVR